MAIQVHTEAAENKGIFVALLTANHQITSNAYVSINSWAAESDNFGPFTFDGTTLTVNESNWYRLHFVGQTDQYSGNNRSSCYSEVRLDGTLIDGMHSASYNRQNLHGFCPLVSYRPIQITSGQQITVAARNHDATRLHQLLANGTILTVETI